MLWLYYVFCGGILRLWQQHYELEKTKTGDKFDTVSLSSLNISERKIQCHQVLCDRTIFFYVLVRLLSDAIFRK